MLETAGIVHGVRAARESLFEFDPQPMEETSILSRISGIRPWLG